MQFRQEAAPSARQDRVRLMILSEREEHRCSGFFRQHLVLAVFDDSDDLVAGLVAAEEVAADRRGSSPNILWRSISFTIATLGVLGPSSQVKSRPASSVVPGGLKIAGRDGEAVRSHHAVGRAKIGGAFAIDRPIAAASAQRQGIDGARGERREAARFVNDAALNRKSGVSSE